LPQISVVVPVYNVEKYLRECLDSLANQTFEDFEVICVNDGSDDSSIDILEEYASEDERFKIVSQENKGLSGARNTGMDYIKGRYLLFLDSDDWLELNALELLYNHANALNSEMVIFPYRYFNQETKEYEENDFTKLNMFDSSVDNKNFNYKNISYVYKKKRFCPYLVQPLLSLINSKSLPLSDKVVDQSRLSNVYSDRTKHFSADSFYRFQCIPVY